MRRQLCLEGGSKRIRIDTKRGIPVNPHLVIKRFKCRRSKCCDFCDNPVRMLIFYDHGDSIGEEVFCCDDCEPAGKAAAIRPFPLCSSDPGIRALIAELDLVNPDEELPLDER